VSSRWYPIAAVALLVLAVGAAVFAAQRDPRSLAASARSGASEQTAPALEAKGWINSRPLTPTALKGKVVLYDFWTYSCVNCVRTIPYLRAWYDRYKDDGLVIIGVHSPEFRFEKDHANVAGAVKKLGIDYPVALDDDMTIWNAFGNQYWPAHYTFDRDGHLADTHFGEGAYAETETLLRKLLGVSGSSPKATVKGSEGGSQTTQDITAETYLGGERGADGFVSPELLQAGEQTFKAPSPEKFEDGNHALEGRWSVSDEYVEAKAKGAVIDLRYTAGQVNLVMASADGKPLDVQVEVDGKVRKTVRVVASDLYSLVADSKVGGHMLRLIAQRPGLQAFAFTFGG